VDELKVITDLLTEPPPAEEAVTRGRARLTTVMSAPPAIRRGHRRVAAGIVAAGAAAAVVLGVGLSGSFGSAARDTGTIRTVAFTLVEHANGTVTLTIKPRVLLDPATLQSDLRQDGIPAVVTNGSFCSSNPVPVGFPQVVSLSPPPAQAPSSAPGWFQGSGKQLTVTINPAALPAGTEVSFGNFQYSSNNSTDTAIELIDTNSNTCSSTLPAPPAAGDGILVTGPLSGNTTFFEAPGS
jgi:hypothetical protein